MAPSAWRRRAAGLMLGVSLAAAAAPPSDIDIYGGNVPGSDRPNILLVLDNSANWSAGMSAAPNCYYNENGVPTSSGPTGDQQTKVGLEKCALYNVVDALPVAVNGAGSDADALFNVGLMLMNRSGANGGYVRLAFTPLTTNNKARIKSMIAGLSRIDDKATNADFGLTMVEAYQYFRGLAPLNGKESTLRDTAAETGGRYAAPGTSSCANNHIIFIGNGASSNGGAEQQVRSLLANAVDTEFAASSAAYRNSLKAEIPDTTGAMGTQQRNWSDEMARFMGQLDFSSRDGTQRVISHAVAVIKGSGDGGFPALMNSIANQGGGRFYAASDVNGITAALLEIFNQVQAVNSVFASASLPVSMNASGTFVNQIFMGMFRPDKEANPRWSGNLKQYRFSMDALGSVFLTDAAGSPAISGSTGFIAPAAVSYWTAASDFWANAPSGTPASASDSPDGDVVEKGGAAQRLRSVHARSQATRKVYTCIACAAGSTLGAGPTTRFETSNGALTAALLGVASSAEREALIDWVRGANNKGDESGPTTTPATTVRPSIHGDVLHSRPAVLNFGGTTGVVVIYGANDGQLRAVSGQASGADAGNELWSFIPEHVLGKLKRLRDNTPDIAVSTTPLGGTATPKDYFLDGPIGVYQKFSASNVTERAIVFVGMRRGGRNLYALDVSVPTAPRLLWTVTPASAGMSLLAQTWSEPKVARVKGYPNPVLLFGGGYDASAEDSGVPTSMGNAIFVLDAFTGALVRSFTTLSVGLPGEAIGRSVAADLTLVDVDHDGYVDRAYALDLGGQVYRVDLESAVGHTPGTWTVYRVADLSGGTTTGRKFFFAPDVVQTRNFVALLMGSGDREKPLLTATRDHFFQIFDRKLTKGAPASASPVTFAGLLAMGSTPTSLGAGCYTALPQGEKVVNAATTIAGKAYFGTNQPYTPGSTTSCTKPNLGRAMGYEMPLFCVSATGAEFEGGGLPPSPVSGLVTLTKPDGSTGLVPFVIGAPNSKRSAIEGSPVTVKVDYPRRRRYWLQETQR
jgi:type IV pilus assembly protein PilY1